MKRTLLLLILAFCLGAQTQTVKLKPGTNKYSVVTICANAFAPALDEWAIRRQCEYLDCTILADGLQGNDGDSTISKHGVHVHGLQHGPRWKLEVAARVVLPLS